MWPGLCGIRREYTEQQLLPARTQLCSRHHDVRAQPFPKLDVQASRAGNWCAGKDRIEQLLALGATRWEAMQTGLQRCVRVALTPILNQMNVVGIVSIPGDRPSSNSQLC
jgi:hypothetical protein